MPLEVMSTADVFDRLGANDFRIYPKANRGVERLSPYAQPHGRAGFAIPPDAAIFATGSCFARNVEKSLKFINFNVVSSPWTLPVPREGEEQSSLYNKYTIHSILNEFKWALSPTPVDHAQYIVADKKGLYHDLNVTSHADVTGTLEEMTAFRAAFNATFAAAATADVIIVTLGMVECWYDTVTQTYLNVMPPKSLIAHHPDRFQFRVLDYNDILAALSELHAIISRDRDTPPNIIVTVSPVGLAATFRPDDVLVANCYSKSVQRAAVEAFTMTHDAHYFPSYEYVTLTDSKFAWADRDFRHVRQETVDRIMADVLLAYAGPSRGQLLLYLRGHGTALHENAEYAKLVELIEPHIVEYCDEADILWLYARGLRQVERREDAVEVCRLIMRMDSKVAHAAGRTAVNTLQMMKDPQGMPDLLDEYSGIFPDDRDFIAKFK